MVDMHYLESVIVHETHKLFDFELQTNHVIPVRKS